MGNCPYELWPAFAGEDAEQNNNPSRHTNALLAFCIVNYSLIFTIFTIFTLMLLNLFIECVLNTQKCINLIVFYKQNDKVCSFRCCTVILFIF